MARNYTKQLINSKAFRQHPIATLVIVALLALGSWGAGTLANGSSDGASSANTNESGTTAAVVQDAAISAASVSSLDEIPAYSGDSPYVEINGNTPEFSEDAIEEAKTAIEASEKGDESKVAALEKYSDLDSLGRCGTASALLGVEIMPTGKRGNISEVHPTGWVHAEYDCIENKNLYNRCHLIAWMLAGEDANRHNLITGTRYMNVDGMLPFEEKLDDYILNTGNHVMYEVTPIFDGDDLVAQGVHMQAWSVEDDGAGISFNIYCYNVQPGVAIDYATGKSWEDASVGAGATGESVHH